MHSSRAIGVNIAARLEGIKVAGAICSSLMDAVSRSAGRLDLAGHRSAQPTQEHRRSNWVYSPEAWPARASEIGGAVAAINPRARRPRPNRALPALASSRRRPRSRASRRGPCVACGLRTTFHNRSPVDDKLALRATASIVVLPFENLSDDKEQDYFADGITDDLTTDLSHLPDSFVIARNTAFTYKGKRVDVKQIGRELGVRYVLEGSVRRLGDKITVNAQLISTETGAHVWADRFDGERSKLGNR